jgi:hypothetical protein
MNTWGIFLQDRNFFAYATSCGSDHVGLAVRNDAVKILAAIAADIDTEDTSQEQFAKSRGRLGHRQRKRNFYLEGGNYCQLRIELGMTL